MSTTIINTIKESFPNKLFGQLLNISPTSVIFLKTFNSEFSYIELWFLLDIEDKINTALVTNCSVRYKNDSVFSSTKRLKFVKGFVFC